MPEKPYTVRNSSPRAIASGEKTGTRCERVLPLSEFVRNNRRADGRQSWCLACTRSSTRQRRERGLDLAGDRRRVEYNKALSELQRRHRDEFDAILAALRGTQ